MESDEKPEAEHPANARLIWKSIEDEAESGEHPEVLSLTEKSELCKYLTSVFCNDDSLNMKSSYPVIRHFVNRYINFRINNLRIEDWTPLRAMKSKGRILGAERISSFDLSGKTRGQD